MREEHFSNHRYGPAEKRMAEALVEIESRILAGGASE